MHISTYIPLQPNGPFTVLLARDWETSSRKLYSFSFRIIAILIKLWLKFKGSLPLGHRNILFYSDERMLCRIFNPHRNPKNSELHFLFRLVLVHWCAHAICGLRGGMECRRLRCTLVRGPHLPVTPGVTASAARHVALPTATVTMATVNHISHLASTHLVTNQLNSILLSIVHE